MSEFVFVRVNSHRAGDKLASLVGKLDWHFTWRDGGKFVRIAASLLPQARAITGITLARVGEEKLSKCWSWK